MLLWTYEASYAARQPKILPSKSRSFIYLQYKLLQRQNFKICPLVSYKSHPKKPCKCCAINVTTTKISKKCHTRYTQHRPREQNLGLFNPLLPSYRDAFTIVIKELEWPGEMCLCRTFLMKFARFFQVGLITENRLWFCFSCWSMLQKRRPSLKKWVCNYKKETSH